MNIRIFSIILLTMFTIISQRLATADTNFPSQYFQQGQSLFCAESSDEKSEEESNEEEEEEEPDCD